MISMKEIGKICGVTESTVSKALRGHAGIKQATRERVAEVARKYGYQPNAMVECMQTGKSRSIGIACNNFQCMFTGAVMDGIHKTLHDYGYDSYVICWDRLVKDDIDLLSRFVRRRVDGLLLLPMVGFRLCRQRQPRRRGRPRRTADCGRAAQNRLGHLHGGQLRRRAAHRFS